MIFNDFTMKIIDFHEFSMIFIDFQWFSLNFNDFPLNSIENRIWKMSGHPLPLKGTLGEAFWLHVGPTLALIFKPWAELGWILKHFRTKNGLFFMFVFGDVFGSSFSLIWVLFWLTLGLIFNGVAVFSCSRV